MRATAVKSYTVGEERTAWTSGQDLRSSRRGVSQRQQE